MFEKVLKNFGFGCMRLPLKDGQINYEEFKEMIDAFIENGFNYFDTAHGYHQGMSEVAIKECLAKRYPRETYVLANKLTNFCFEKEEDIRPFFLKQLDLCGVEYFDFYLMHAQSAENFVKYKKCRAYEVALELKREGKIKHFGISFHDTAEVLDKILNEYPQIEFVQLQFNYLDYNDPAVQSKKCYDVCSKHHKPVIVMEPIKGGNLAHLPKKADDIITKLDKGSPASIAIRFAASFEKVFMVLSGMSNIEQMKENISFMKKFEPIDSRTKEAIESVCKIYRSMNFISCTACRYCIDGCPQRISIPDLFACLNAKRIHNDWNSNFYYFQVHTKNHGKASDCIGCSKCEKVCPQHLPIRNLLKEVSDEFEK